MSAVSLVLLATLFTLQDSERWLSPPISRDQFEESITLLDFLPHDPTQFAVRALYAQLTTACRQHGAGVADKMNQAHSDEATYRAQHPGTTDAWVEHGEDFGRNEIYFSWRAVRRRLQSQFEQEVSNVLEDPTRREVWERWIKRLRRDRVLPEINRATQVGYDIDLISIIESLRLHEHELATIDTTIHQYESGIDDVLRRWEHDADSLQMRMASAAKDMRKGDQDDTALAELHEELAALGKAVGQVSATYAVLLADALGEETRQRFTDSIARANHPRLFNPSPVDLVVERLRVAAFLSASQRDDLEGIYRAYCVERDLIRREIILGIARWESADKITLARRRAMYQQYLATGSDEPNEAFAHHPAGRWLQRDYELAKATLASIAALLDGNEQSLPAAVRILLSVSLR